MDETERKQLTERNEQYVGEWFEGSGFHGEKLDTGSGKKGKRADWRFVKDDLVVLCEVKTIFSGGQSGLTEEQYERRRRENRHKFDNAKERATEEGNTLLVTRDELDYLEGKVDYRKRPIRKEEEFRRFCNGICEELKGDPAINQFPISVTISVPGMYVVYGKERDEFVNWLKECIRWSSEHPRYEFPPTTRRYVFRQRQKANDGTIQNSIEAFVQFWSKTQSPLDVGFLEGGGSYNEDAVVTAIKDAILQLRASARENANSGALQIIGVWSASRIYFTGLLYSDAINARLDNLPERYYLFDWAFQEYPDLAAFVLFEIGREGDIMPTPHDKFFPIGYVITNPNMPEVESVLRLAISKNCTFITGIASDPLDSLLSQD